MMPQEMIPLLNINVDAPPWDGEIKEIRATVMANRDPVRVRVLDVYAYYERKMARVQAIQGRPFPETNAWYHDWYTNRRNFHLAFLQDVTLVY